MAMVVNPKKTPGNLRGQNVSNTTFSKKWANTKGGVGKPSAPPKGPKKV